MNHETIEQRIERLENSVRVLNEFVKQAPATINAQNTVLVELLQLYLLLDNDKQIIFRFIGEFAAGAGFASGQALLDAVSRAESKQDFLAATIADIKSRIKIDPPNPESK